MSNEPVNTVELTERQVARSRAAFLVGPALMAGYGVVRLIGRAVGDYGPGVWWTVAHLLFLAGVVVFAAVFRGLEQLAVARDDGRAAVARGDARAAVGRGDGRVVVGRGGGRVAARAAAWTGLAGAAAVAVQAVIDLVVGFVAADKQAMSDLFERVQDVPGVMPLVYTVVPLLFWVGLLALVTLLAVHRRDVVRPWVPVLVTAGTVLMAVSLDLLAVGALCIGVALEAVRRRMPGQGAAARGSGRRVPSATGR
ncbi:MULTISPECIES: hypothetical protein [unclassified Streptomyces]|uniref:hypothetical protein n=1 Tax=unclassified Streptomyces TaxID=2593676 RepID=UPI0036EA08B9